MADASTNKDGPLVLVVDDEPHLRLYLAAVYESGGYTAAKAKNGIEGLAKAKTLKPALISLDLMMPEEGGLKLYRELKADPELAVVPVLIVSAVPYAVFKHALTAMRHGLDPTLAGPEAYIEKPPEAPVVLAAAAKLLGRV